MLDKNFIILKNQTIIQAMKLINTNLHKCLIVVDGSKKMLGTLSDGDIRTALLKDFNLDSKINSIFNKKGKFIYKKDVTKEKLKKIFLKQNYDILPILNNKKIVEDVTYWSKIFNPNIKNINKLETQVVIMAGGEGSRMKPFTHILPKPLIPINEKPIIEHIMEKFIVQGITNFLYTINHKAEIMKAYFRETKSRFKIKYIQEKKPLGTAGSLKLLKKTLKKNFFVINCDTLANIDCKDIIKFHEKKKNLITIIASAKQHIIPYGICNINKKGELKKITEKPKINFLASSGIYLVNQRALKLIPNNKKFDFPQLISLAKKRGYKIGVFPIDDSSWFDVGQWEEYRKTIDKMKINEN